MEEQRSFRCLIETNDDGCAGTQLVSDGTRFYLYEWGIDSPFTPDGLEEIDSDTAESVFWRCQQSPDRVWPENAPGHGCYVDLAAVEAYDSAVLEYIRRGGEGDLILPFDGAREW